jgi:hypothetical protein
MNMPTKPGKYLVLGYSASSRSPGPGIVTVFMSTPENRPSRNGISDGGPYFLAVHFSDGGGPGNASFDMTVEEWTRCYRHLTWGERIPDNDALKAMRELAAENPDDGDDPIYRCRWCMSTKTGEHTLSCPWLRAQEKE